MEVRAYNVGDNLFSAAGFFSRPLVSCFVTSLLLLTIFSKTAAQPGGGGGMYIVHFYDSNCQPIDVNTDSLLTVRVFSLKDSLVYQENYYYKPHYPLAPRYWNPTALRPQENVELMGKRRFSPSDQRMLITYNKDTMMIDFLGVPAENGAGYKLQMDSIVIQSGYFQYRCAMYNARIIPSITGRSKKELISDSIITYREAYNLAFLNDEHKQASFLLNEAKYLLTIGANEAALETLRRAIAKNNGMRDCPVLFLESKIFSALKRYDATIASLAEGMHCEDNFGRNYRQNTADKIENYIQYDQLDKALCCYDTLIMVEVAAGKLSGRSAKAFGELTDLEKRNDFVPGMLSMFKRAQFKIKYLHDVVSARQDLWGIIAAIPDYYIEQLTFGSSPYADVYFDLANLEYRAKATRKAFRHWLIAMELQSGQHGGYTLVPFFDTLILHHPRNADLYLARAIAQYQQWADPDAYKDLDKAERLNPKDFRVNIYRSKMLAVTGQYEKALREANRAIGKNVGDPRGYLQRYHVRNKVETRMSKDIVYISQDTDMIRYRMARGSWVFPK